MCKKMKLIDDRNELYSTKYYLYWAECIKNNKIYVIQAKTTDKAVNCLCKDCLDKTNVCTTKTRCLA